MKTTQEKTVAKLAKPHSVNTTAGDSNKRRLKQPKRKLRDVRSWFIRRPVPERSKVPSTYTILKKSLHMLREIWPQMVGSTVLLALFTLIFVSSSTTSVNFQQLHNVVKQYGLTTAELSTVVFAQLSTLANVTPAANTVASVYQMIIFVLFSLAFIWAFRQFHAEEKNFTTKDMFYSSTGSLTQLVLVLALLTFALIPLLVSLFLYNTLITGLIAVSGLQRTFAYVICALLAYVSARFLTGWLFGIYISGLPQMTPIPAVKYGTKLVYGRRLVVLRKLMLFAALMLLVLALLLIPCVFWAPIMAPWLFFLFSVVTIPVSHAFIYTLYKELLG